MEHFNKFITEVQKIEIRVTKRYFQNGKIVTHYTPDEVPLSTEIMEANLKTLVDVLDLNHYHQKKSDYEAHLKELQQLALNEVSLLSFHQIEIQQKRLKQISDRLKTFWPLYFKHFKNFRENQFDIVDFEIEVYPLFIISKHESGLITREFFSGFSDAVMYKRGYLLGLESQIRELFSSEKKPKQTSFMAAIDPEKLPGLLQRLIDGKYIASETTLQSFEAVFNGLPLPDNFEPVKWIQHPKRNKNTTAKKALTDLLLLTGTPKEQTQDINKLKICFIDYTGNPLIYTQSNFNNSKDFKEYSEYYQELKTIIESL